MPNAVETPASKAAPTAASTAPFPPFCPKSLLPTLKELGLLAGSMRVRANFVDCSRTLLLTDFSKLAASGSSTLATFSGKRGPLTLTPVML